MVRPIKSEDLEVEITHLRGLELLEIRTVWEILCKQEIFQGISNNSASSKTRTHHFESNFNCFQANSPLSKQGNIWRAAGVSREIQRVQCNLKRTNI